jgi:hypothetical protein NreA
MKHTTHESHPDIVNRLKRADGHLKKVIAMLEHGESCVSIAQQLHGVYKALGNAKTILIQDHIEHCLDESIIGTDVKSQKSTIAEFKEITKYL